MQDRLLPPVGIPGLGPTEKRTIGHTPPPRLRGAHIDSGQVILTAA